MINHPRWAKPSTPFLPLGLFLKAAARSTSNSETAGRTALGSRGDALPLLAATARPACSLLGDTDPSVPQTADGRDSGRRCRPGPPAPPPRPPAARPSVPRSRLCTSPPPTYFAAGHVRGPQVGGAGRKVRALRPARVVSAQRGDGPGAAARGRRVGLERVTRRPARRGLSRDAHRAHFLRGARASRRGRPPPFLAHHERRHSGSLLGGRGEPWSPWPASPGAHDAGPAAHANARAPLLRLPCDLAQEGARRRSIP